MARFSGQPIAILYVVDPSGKLVPMPVDANGVLQTAGIVGQREVTPSGQMSIVCCGVDINGKLVPISVDANGAINTTGSGVGALSHGDLTDLGIDDHPQYVLADGSRPFTAPIQGVSPVDVFDLVTKGYVDTGLTTEISTATSAVITQGTQGPNDYTVTKIYGIQSWIITGVNVGREIEVELHFSGIVGTPTEAWLRAFYSGGSHTVEVQHWNYITLQWDTQHIMTSVPALEWFVWPLPVPSVYVSGGESKMRFYHSNNHTPNHTLQIDYCALAENALSGRLTALELGNLADVNAPAPNNGDVLTWNAATGKWIPVAP